MDIYLRYGACFREKIISFRHPKWAEEIVSERVVWITTRSRAAGWGTGAAIRGMAELIEDLSFW